MAKEWSGAAAAAGGGGQCSMCDCVTSELIGTHHQHTVTQTALAYWTPWGVGGILSLGVCDGAYHARSVKLLGATVPGSAAHACPTCTDNLVVPWLRKIASEHGVMHCTWCH